MRRAVSKVFLPVLIGLSILVEARMVRAGVVFEADRLTFLSQTTALQTQTFAGANIQPNGLAVESSSLNSLTNDQVFRAGTILPGISFSTSDAGIGRDLELTGAGPGSPSGGGGPGGFTNNVLHPAFYFSPLQITFSSPQTAVGLGLLTAFADGPTGLETVSVYSTGGGLLGSITTEAADFGSGSFLGILTTGDDSIGLVTVAATSAGFTNFYEPGVDLVQFGTAVPEPSSLVLGAIAGLTTLGYAWRFRRSINLEN